MGNTRYLTLDGLRGIAAICIAFLHMPHFFTYFPRPESAYLAVDFFFILSGFVLSFAYDKRIESGLAVGNFFLVRFIRLYPAYVLGFILGAFVAVAAIYFPGSALSVKWSTDKLACALSFGAVMLPTPPCDGNTLLYPLNPVMWSIFFELIISMVFFATHRLFRNTTYLIALVAVSGLLLAYFHVAGTSDSGFDLSQLHIGFVRVAFGFFMGVALFRLFPHKEQKASLWGLVAISVLLAFLLLSPFKSPVFTLPVVFVVFPILVLVGARIAPPASLNEVVITAGAVSYVLYALHKPIYQLALGALSKVYPSAPAYFVQGFGIVFFILLVAFCVVVERLFERPAREALKSMGLNLLARRRSA